MWDFYLLSHYCNVFSTKSVTVEYISVQLYNNQLNNLQCLVDKCNILIVCGVNIPDVTMCLVIQKSPAIGHRNQEAVGHGDWSVSLCVV